MDKLCLCSLVFHSLQHFRSTFLYPSISISLPPLSPSRLGGPSEWCTVSDMADVPTELPTHRGLWLHLGQGLGLHAALRTDGSGWGTGQEASGWGQHGLIFITVTQVMFVWISIVFSLPKRSTDVPNDSLCHISTYHCFSVFLKGLKGLVNGCKVARQREIHEE